MRLVLHSNRLLGRYDSNSISPTHSKRCEKPRALRTRLSRLEGTAIDFLALGHGQRKVPFFLFHGALRPCRPCEESIERRQRGQSHVGYNIRPIFLFSNDVATAAIPRARQCLPHISSTIPPHYPCISAFSLSLLHYDIEYSVLRFVLLFLYLTSVDFLGLALSFQSFLFYRDRPHQPLRHGVFPYKDIDEWIR